MITLQIFLLVLIIEPGSLACSPGEYLESLAGQNCKECPPGTFQKDHNNNTACTKCTPKCDGQRKEVRSCSKTHDIKCECPIGRYYNTGLSFCASCKTCSSGFVTGKNCTPEEDTVCIRVKEFPTKETLKTDHPTPSTWPRNNTEAPTSTIEPSSTSATETDVQYIFVEEPPIYKILTIVFGSMIVVMAGVLLIIYWKTCQGRHWKLPIRTLASAEGSDVSLIGAKDSTMKLRDVPASVIEDLAELLNPPSTKNWRRLAGKLGFTQQQVGNLALMQKEATQSLLQEWSTRENATVARLHNVLQDMGRHDAAKVLQCCLSAHGTLV